MIRPRRKYLIEIHFTSGTIARFWSCRFTISSTEASWIKLKGLGPMRISLDHVVGAFIIKKGWTIA